MDTEMETQTEEIVLRFRTKKPLGLLLITSTAETGDRVELAVAAGRIRMALRMGVRKKKDEDKEKDKILLAGQHVNDNEWHTIKFSRRGVNLKLQLDGHTPLRAETHGTYTTLQWRRIYIGGVQDELGMSTTVPNFVGEIQQFYFNGISYIELAKSSSTEQKIAGFPAIKVAAKFVKRLINNLHRPVTFRSQHTFIGLPMLRAYSSIHVDFLFKTKHANGLILFNGGKKDDFIAIELVNGHIHYVLNVGEGAIKLKDASKTPLNDNHWHTVGIRRPSLKQHTLMVDDDVEIVAANQGTGHLELDGILYVGGVHRDLYSQLPQGDVKSKLGFEGCIAGLDLNGESPNIMEDAVIHSSEVTAGCESQSSKCDRNFCANGGVCVQQWPSYTCDCDMTSFTGPNCSDESIAYEFGPNRGIITYTFPEDRRPEMQDDAIALGFITSKSDAVLLRLVSGTSTDYIELEIVDGNVFMVYNLGTHDHPVGEISFKVNDNAYHVVKFRRFGSNATLQVDDYNVQYVAPSGDQLQVFNSQSQIQIGGKWSPGKSRIERPFTGIIAGVVVNGIRILDLAAAKDVHTFTRGDVQLISNILERHIDTNDLHKMQQTPASGFSGVMDDLVLSGSGSGCNNGDDEDECPPLPDSGGTDDLITPVFIPPTKPPPTTKLPPNPNEPEPCDDEECGSASGEITEEPPSTSSKGTSAEVSGLNVTETSTHQGTDGSSTYTSEGGSTGVSSSSENTRKTESHSTISTDADTAYPDGSSSSITTSSSTSSDQTTTTTTMTHKIPDTPPTRHDEFPFVTTKPPRKKPTERVHSEMSEAVALIIGIIAGALIAVILIILVILKFKSRGDRSYKVDDGKGGYQHGPSTALLGNNGSANEQTPYQLNGALRNGETRGQMQKSNKKRDSKDIKEWYV
ncbi:neurexin-3-like [Agrilus planipennis]|uniref:Neurexin-3-like n=1 Tax=Agrilus planipennis TaxID=224129 RepID=A0A7F5RMV5_AGRPL|nr:neurexin-3-like [Agrilus planipennis]